MWFVRSTTRLGAQVLSQSQGGPQSLLHAHKTHPPPAPPTHTLCAPGQPERGIRDDELGLRNSTLLAVKSMDTQMRVLLSASRWELGTACEEW